MLPVESCNSMKCPSLALVPVLTIRRSLTAITGEPRLAKIDVPFVFGSESIAIAALAPLTLRLANATTESSAYFAAAATGKWPCTKPVNAPINCDGIPPINFARNNTDCTYQPAWLYAKIARDKSLDAPAACKYRAAVKIASTGLYG